MQAISYTTITNKLNNVIQDIRGKSAQITTENNKRLIKFTGWVWTSKYTIKKENNTITIYKEESVYLTNYELMIFTADLYSTKELLENTQALLEKNSLKYTTDRNQKADNKITKFINEHILDQFEGQTERDKTINFLQKNNIPSTSNTDTTDLMTETTYLPINENTEEQFQQIESHPDSTTNDCDFIFMKNEEITEINPEAQQEIEEITKINQEAPQEINDENFSENDETNGLVYKSTNIFSEEIPSCENNQDTPIQQDVIPENPQTATINAKTSNIQHDHYKKQINYEKYFNSLTDLLSFIYIICLFFTINLTTAIVVTILTAETRIVQNHTTHSLISKNLLIPLLSSTLILAILSGLNLITFMLSVNLILIPIISFIIINVNFIISTVSCYTKATLNEISKKPFASIQLRGNNPIDTHGNSILDRYSQADQSKPNQPETLT